MQSCKNGIYKTESQLKHTLCTLSRLSLIIAFNASCLISESQGKCFSVSVRILTLISVRQSESSSTPLWPSRRFMTHSCHSFAHFLSRSLSLFPVVPVLFTLSRHACSVPLSLCFPCICDSQMCSPSLQGAGRGQRDGRVPQTQTHAPGQTGQSHTEWVIRI